MFHCVPLLAGISIFQVVVLFIVFASWLFRLAFGVAKKEVPQPRRAPGRPVAERAPRIPKAQPAGSPDLSKEIEEFLKRAAQRRGSKARRETAAAAPVSPGKKPVRRLAESLPTLEADPGPAPTGAGVAQHVEQHMSTQEFSVRAAHLADDVVHAEQEMQQHLKQAFSHQVGRLADTSHQAVEDKATAAAATAKAAAPPAPDLTSMLADGNNVRQAIILNEILQRPEHRW